MHVHIIAASTIQCLHAVYTQIEINRGHGSRKEVEFLISPGAGRAYAVRGLHSQTGKELGGAISVSFGKKPFDWLSETQWQMFLVRISYYWYL